MNIVQAVAGEPILLGRAGENLHTKIVFDVSAWLEEYPEAELMILMQRPGDSAAYPVHEDYVQLEDTQLFWTLTNADLRSWGVGKCELMMIKDTVIVKSAIWEVLIESALNGSDDPPEPFSNWLAEYDEIQQRSVEAIENVEAATQSLLDMTVAAETLEPGAEATVQKEQDETGAVHLMFGIPEGKRGNSVDNVDYDQEAGNLVFTMEDGDTHDVSMDDVKAHIDESIQESNAYVEQRLEEVQPDWQKVVDAAEAAEASKTAAAASAEAADQSATSANGFRTMAARYASDANNSAAEAKRYRDNANTYNEQASSSAQQAATQAGNAKTSADQAQAQAEQAAEHEDKAYNSEMSAIAAQASAEAAYELAMQAKNEAGEMKTGAEQARDEAQAAAAQTQQTVDSAAEQILADANSYADEQLEAAKEYADGIGNTAASTAADNLTAAKKYADDQRDAAISHADSSIQQANDRTDNAVKGLKDYTDKQLSDVGGQIYTLQTDIQTKATKTEMSQAVANIETTLETYSDENLDAAKEYADGKLTETENYVDEQLAPINETVTGLSDDMDTKADQADLEQAVTDLQAYSDTNLGTAKSYADKGDSAINTKLTLLEDRVDNNLTEAKGYTDQQVSSLGGTVQTLVSDIQTKATKTEVTQALTNAKAYTDEQLSENAMVKTVGPSPVATFTDGADNMPMEVTSQIDGNDVSEVEMVFAGKNLLNITAETQTINGVTFTNNQDGTIHVSGTASAATYLPIGSTDTLPEDSYVWGGNPEDASTSTYFITRNNGSGNFYSIISNAYTVSDAQSPRIYVRSGVTLDVVFKPGIYKASEVLRKTVQLPDPPGSVNEGTLTIYRDGTGKLQTGSDSYALSAEQAGQVTSLQGFNTVWSTGNVTVQYVADISETDVMRTAIEETDAKAKAYADERDAAITSVIEDGYAVTTQHKSLNTEGITQLPLEIKRKDIVVVTISDLVVTGNSKNFTGAIAFGQAGSHSGWAQSTGFSQPGTMMFRAEADYSAIYVWYAGTVDSVTVSAYVRKPREELSIRARLDQLDMHERNHEVKYVNSSTTAANWMSAFWCTTVDLDIRAGEKVKVCVSNLKTSGGAMGYYVILTDKEHFRINDSKWWYTNNHFTEPGVTTVTAPRDCDVVMVFYDSVIASTTIDSTKVTAWIDGKVKIPGNFSILGDSISTYAGYLPEGNSAAYPGNGILNTVEDTWWYRFADAMGCALQVNESWNGAPICYDGWGDGTTDATTTAFIARMTKLPQSDMIIVFGGTNDAWVGAELGDYVYADWTEAQKSQFRPALAYMLDWLKHHHVGAKIVFMKNNLGSTYQTYLDSIDTVCAHYNVPVVELTYTDMQSNHPTAAGMRDIAVQLVDALVTEK